MAQAGPKLIVFQPQLPLYGNDRLTSPYAAFMVYTLGRLESVQSLRGKQGQEGEAQWQVCGFKWVNGGEGHEKMARTWKD